MAKCATRELGERYEGKGNHTKNSRCIKEMRTEARETRRGPVRERKGKKGNRKEK